MVLTPCSHLSVQHRTSIALLTNKVPEGPALEYKGMLPISTRDERREALKDLSGMGNGGGGTVVGRRDDDLPIVHVH